MSSISDHPAPASPAPKEAAERRKAAWAMFAVVVISTISAGWFGHNWSFMWENWVAMGGLGLYWLWLSSPRLGSARFEAHVTKNAIHLVPLAFLLGALFGALTEL